MEGIFLSFFDLFYVTLDARKQQSACAKNRVHFQNLTVDHSNIEYAFLSFNNVGYDFVSLLVHLVTFLEHS